MVHKEDRESLTGSSRQGSACARWDTANLERTLTAMKKRIGLRASRKAVACLLPVLAVSTTGCLGYPAEGAVSTPAAPGQSGPSRLPQLLQQLQGGGAGLELFDSPQNQVLAAQDAQGKAASTPGASETVAGAKTPGITTVAQQPPATNTPKPPTPTKTPTGGAATTTPTGTASMTPTTTATPTPTPTPTPTGIPTEGSGGSGPAGTPPTEQ